MAGQTTRTFYGTSRGLALVTVVIALHSTACATMARGAGSTQNVLVTSAPSGAQVFIGQRPVGVTPVRLDLKRRDSRIVLRVEQDGFMPQDIPVRQSLTGWLAFDLFPLNPYIAQGLNSADQGPTKWQRAGLLTLAFGVDFLTGAAYTLPPVVHAVLSPLRDATSFPPSSRRQRD